MQFYKKDPYVTDNRVWPVLEHMRSLEHLFSQFDQHVHTKWFKLDDMFDLQKTVNAVRECEEAIEALVEVSKGCQDKTVPTYLSHRLPQPDRSRPYCLRRQTLGRLEDAAEDISAKFTMALNRDLRVGGSIENFKIPRQNLQATVISEKKSEKDDKPRQPSIPPPPPLPKLPSYGQATVRCHSQCADVRCDISPLGLAVELDQRPKRGAAKGSAGKTPQSL